jgi:Tfp pilus assembly protein PilN
MRPINLIPDDERRGGGGGGNRKGGPLAYILIGALAILLLGVTLIVSTNNEISSSKAEIVELNAENAAAKAKAAKLTAYTELRKVRDQRVETVTSLAESRFDWERVMRELALILPSDVWLTNLTGTVKPDVSVEGSASVVLRAGVAGPALELVGCANGQEGVAGFVTALKDIDGVSRVAMEYSQLGAAQESGAAETGDSAPASGGAECQTRNFIAQFQIVAAFDAAPVPAEAAPEEAAVAPEEAAAPEEAEPEAG